VALRLSGELNIATKTLKHLEQSNTRLSKLQPIEIVKCLLQVILPYWHYKNIESIVDLFYPINQYTLSRNAWEDFHLCNRGYCIDVLLQHYLPLLQG